MSRKELVAHRHQADAVNVEAVMLGEPIGGNKAIRTGQASQCAEL